MKRAHLVWPTRVNEPTYIQFSVFQSRDDTRNNLNQLIDDEGNKIKNEFCLIESVLGFFYLVSVNECVYLKYAHRFKHKMGMIY